MKKVMVNFICNDKLISRLRMSGTCEVGDEITFGETVYKVVKRKRDLMNYESPAGIQHNAGDYSVFIERIN